MRRVVDPLQGAARHPPGHLGVRTGLRPGPDPPRRGPSVSASQQPPTPVHQPKGDQPTATDVAGKGITKTDFNREHFKHRHSISHTASNPKQAG